MGRFKDVFSIIGPAMIGPSSSHTAGAARLGLVARQLLGCRPERAVVTFYGSFAETYLGHGTDLAMAGGLLGYDTDDSRIPRAIRDAAAAGMHIGFERGRGPAPHPNTARIRVTAANRTVELLGMSIGGGNIEIAEVDGFQVRFTALAFTLVVWHADRQGLIADLTGLLHAGSVNIASMETGRKGRGGKAMTVIESDDPVERSLRSRMVLLPGVEALRIVSPAMKKKNGA